MIIGMKFIDQLIFLIHIIFFKLNKFYTPKNCFPKLTLLFLRRFLWGQWWLGGARFSGPLPVDVNVPTRGRV